MLPPGPSNFRSTLDLADWLVGFYLGFKVDFSGLFTAKSLTASLKAKLKCTFLFFYPQKRLPQIYYPMIPAVQHTQSRQLIILQSLSYKAILENSIGKLSYHIES